MAKTKTDTATRYDKPVSLRIPQKIQEEVERGAKKLNLSKADVYRLSIESGVRAVLLQFKRRAV